MIFIKTNETLYPAKVNGLVEDKNWSNRSSKSITLTMSYNEAINLFATGCKWSIVQQNEVPVFDEKGDPAGTEVQEIEYNNDEYCIAGDITDHRDGTITVKMGKLTELEEVYEMMLGGIV